MHNSVDIPEVVLSLELPASLNRILALNDPQHEAVQKALVQGMAEIMETLGIPGIPGAQITNLPENYWYPGKWLRVSVNGRPCSYPNELLAHAYNYANGGPRILGSNLISFLPWLREFTNDRERFGFSFKIIVEFLRLTCLEITKTQPDVLLDMRQVEVYAASLLLPASDNATNLPAKQWPPDPIWLYPILKKLLQLKISIADKQKVAKVLWEAPEQSQEDIAENLIMALRQDIVDIQLPQAHLKRLTMIDPTNALNIFTSIREGLLLESGLRFPKFRFALADDLKPGSFAFKVHHLRMLPWISPSSDPLGHLKLCFTDILRENRACFVDLQAVKELLERLYMPALVDAIEAKCSIEQVTRILRELVVEGISMRNLIPILERMLDYDYLISDPSKIFCIENRFAASGEPLNETWLKETANMISFIKMGLRSYIATSI
jgi:hypothetical protein